jgi:hypothetical protein
MKIQFLIFFLTYSYINTCGADKPLNVTDCIMYSTDTNSCCYAEVNKQATCIDANRKYYGSKTIDKVLYTCDLQYIKNTDIDTNRICGLTVPTTAKECDKNSLMMNSCCLTYIENTPTCVYLGYKALHDMVTADFSYTPLYCIDSTYIRLNILLMLVLFIFVI